jgi:anti-anti-sigma factor
MEITIKKLGQYSVVHAAGKIDAVTCPTLEESLNRLFDQGERFLILDLGDVSYISSAGLRILLVAAKKLYGDGQFALCRLSKEVREVMEMVGFTKIMSIYDDAESARAGLSKR